MHLHHIVSPENHTSRKPTNSIGIVSMALKLQIFICICLVICSVDNSHGREASFIDDLTHGFQSAVNTVKNTATHTASAFEHGAQLGYNTVKNGATKTGQYLGTQL